MSRSMNFVQFRVVNGRSGTFQRHHTAVLRTLDRTRVTDLSSTRVHLIEQISSTCRTPVTTSQAGVTTFGSVTTS